MAIILFLVSFAIELSQFVFSVGLPETDDVVANVIAGGVGYWLYRLLKKYRNGLKNYA